MMVRAARAIMTSTKRAMAWKRAKAKATKRAMVWKRVMARVARVMAMAMRVAGNEEGKGGKGAYRQDLQRTKCNAAVIAVVAAAAAAAAAARRQGRMQWRHFG
jgi:hypothetical protein